MIVSYVIIALLLVCLSFISASAIAFSLLTPHSADHLRNHPSRCNNAVLRLLSEKEYLFATIDIIRVTVIVFLALLCGAYLYPSGSWIVQVLLIALLLLLSCDTLAKVLAYGHPVWVARVSSLPLVWFKSVLKPVTFIMVRSGSRIRESVSQQKVDISIDELSNAIEITADQSAEQKRLLSGIVEFVNTEVSQIMKPRVDIVALNIEADFTTVKRVIIEAGFSRIPVYEESLDNLKGMLYVKDMLPYIYSSGDFDWRSFLRKPYFVPEHKMINDLLEEFRAHQVHIAVVVDEYGSTMGVVSLEDILEEIVGEISDESDVEQQFYTKVSPNVYIFDGKTHLSDFLDVVAFDDEYFDYVKGEAETIAGLMLEIRKDFLTQGEVIYCLDLMLLAEVVDGRRIDKVRVTLPK